MVDDQVSHGDHKPQDPAPNDGSAPFAATLSKNAKKKLLKQQRLEQKKAERKAAEKQKRKNDLERRRREWDEKLANVSEEEKRKLIEGRKEARKERMGKRSEEREMKVARLRKAMEEGQKIVVDLEFGDLMAPNEIHSLVQQIMYCYAVNGKCVSPAHLWLTGCRGEMESHLQKIPGYNNWIIGKESRSYIEALQDHKENLVYLTADADTILDELDLKKTYIIGGLVDRNRWKGITLKKAQEQGIQVARLPIDSYLKMSSSQVLTVNQVVEILLKFLETKDWKAAFFQVIPPRKRDGAEADNASEEAAASEPEIIEHLVDAEDNEIELDNSESEERECKKKRVEESTNGN